MTPASPSLADWLSEQPFTLTLSSGFFGFFAHLGVAQALWERQLYPAAYSGSSAGALVGGCLAAGCPPEQLETVLCGLQRQHFWDPAPGLGLLAGQAFRRLLRDILPHSRIEDTPLPLALSVWHGRSRQTRVLREGCLVEAIYASCAVPILFQPARIAGDRYWDGGIADRHGLAGTEPDQRVLYHHLSSRSPWRRRNSPALQPPQRHNLVSLILPGLPRSGPGKLEIGKIARQQAYQRARQALDLPVQQGQIVLAEATLEP